MAIGHSIGEYSAAAIAGIFSLEDGVRVAAARGRAMAAVAPGAMTAVQAAEAEVEPHVGDGLTIANVNAPRLTVVAGSTADIEAFEARLGELAMPHLRLAVDRAFHTEGMRAVSLELEEALGRVALGRPRIPCYSNVTGRPLTDEEATSPAYWTRQAASPVRFLECVRAAEAASSGWYLEVGPGNGLGRYVQQALGSSADGRVVTALGGRRAPQPATLLGSIAALWRGATDVSWERFGRERRARKVPIPTYPFERRRCWFGDGRPAEESPRVPEPSPNQPEPSTAAAGNGDVRAVIREIVADVAGIDRASLAEDVAFVEQGLESLALLEVAETIRDRLGPRVALPDLLEDLATIDALARHVEERCTSVPEPPAVAPAPVRDGGARAPVTPFAAPSADGKLGEQQRAYVADLVTRYVARTGKSKAYSERYRQPHADPRNSAGFRSAWKEIVYPLVVDRSDGASVWDLDDNRYVDLTMAFGAALFGHSPPFVREALTAQIRAGIAVGPQTAGSGPVADQLCRVTGLDRAVFTNSGTEAVMAAIRLARASTRRDRLVVFQGSYHGTYDGVLARRTATPAALGVPGSLVSDVIVLPYGTEEVLELLSREGETIAAVVVEPVQSRNPSLQPREHLQEIRAATRAAGTVLVLDEMITGFRAHPGGVNALWGIDADLVTYGKALGGGLPIGAVAGRAQLLDLIDGGDWRYGDDSRPEAELTFFAGTFCKHPLGMAAAHAVLAEIERAGPRLQEDLSARTAGLVAEIEAGLEELDRPVEVERFASQFSFRPGAADSIADLYFKELLLRGVYVWEGRTSFLSTAHSDDDLADVAGAAVDSARRLLEAQALAPRRRPAETVAVTSSDGWFPCRDEQRLLWLGMQMNPEAAGAYNEVLTIPLGCELDAGVVEQTARTLVGSHDALRLRLAPDGDRQRVAADTASGFEVVEVGEDERRWERAREVVAALRDTSFDLERGPIVRSALLRARADESAFVLVAPHLAVDGWSLSLLRDEFAKTYAAIRSGAGSGGGPARRFADFVAWESAGSDDGGRAVEYWHERLAGVDPSPVLPGVPSGERSYRARTRRHDFAPGTAARLGKLCGTVGATPFSAGVAAWCTALASVTGKDDITVASTFAGQAEVGWFDLVGYCLKVLPVRVAIGASFASSVAAAHAAVSEAREHWFVDESALIERFWARRDSARPPMGGVTFQYERPEREVVVPGARSLDVDLVGRSYTKWDATMVLVHEAESLSAELAYTPAGLDDDQAAALLLRFAEILEDGCRGVSAAGWETAGIIGVESRASGG